MKLNVGLIGIGEDWETRHRPALKSLTDRFLVKGVYSENSVKSQRVAADFEARQFQGFRELIRREEIEAVLCLSQDWIGALPMFAACEYGKSIYSASALDMDSTQARQFKQKVEESGVAFMAEFARRHTPATIRLKELIATRLGQPKLVFCTEQLPQVNCESGDHSFADDRQLILELIDWCGYIVGQQPSSIQALQMKYPSVNSVSGYKQLNLSYSNQDAILANAQIRISRILPGSWTDAFAYRRPAGMQVACENGMAYIDSPTTIIWFDDAGQHSEALDAERPVGEQMFTLFHRAVTSLVRKTNDLESAYLARLIFSRAEESCRTQRNLKLD